MTAPGIHVRTDVKSFRETRQALDKMARTVKAMDYKTAERDTGKIWTDGKRVYRRCGSVAGADEAAATLFNVGTSASISAVIDFGGVAALTAGGRWIQMPFLVVSGTPDTTDGSRFRVVTSGDDLLFQVESTWNSSSYTFNGWIEYTKA